MEPVARCVLLLDIGHWAGDHDSDRWMEEGGM